MCLAHLIQKVNRNEQLANLILLKGIFKWLTKSLLYGSLFKDKEELVGFI